MTPDESLFLENQLCFPLYATSRLTTQLYGPLLKDLDITYPQYLVLLVLWKNDQLTVSEISRALYLESNTLTPLLKRMEQKQLVKRQRSQTDERSVMVSLTEEGVKLKEKAVCIPEKIVEGFSGGDLTLEEVMSFKSTLMKILSALDQKQTVEG